MRRWLASISHCVCACRSPTTRARCRCDFSVTMKKSSSFFGSLLSAGCGLQMGKEHVKYWLQIRYSYQDILKCNSLPVWKYVCKQFKLFLPGGSGWPYYGSLQVVIARRKRTICSNEKQKLYGVVLAERKGKKTEGRSTYTFTLHCSCDRRLPPKPGRRAICAVPFKR